MALTKQNVNFNFSFGLDQKKDPFQIPLGKFYRLQNSVFDKEGRLQKRNGFPFLPSLPDSTSTYVTTFNGNLTALSKSFNALADGSDDWINKGAFEPLTLSTLPLIRNSTNQTQVDTAIASNGLICTVYTDVTTAATLYRYAVADSVTGQNILIPTAITPTSGTVSNGIRVFILGGYFVIVFSTSTNHLQYIRINILNPTETVAAANDITTSYTGISTVAWDGVVTNNTLYLAWNGNDGGGAIRMTSYNSAFTRSTSITGTNVANTKSATVLSVCADETQSTPVIWVSFYTTTGTVGFVLAVNQALSSVLAATSIIAAGTILNITASAQNMVLTVFYEVSTAYSYGATLPTNIITSKTITQAGVVSSATTIRRSVGVASKSFILDSIIYVLSVYSSPYQSTYFLLKSDGTIVSKLAYGNAGGYLTLGLPSVHISNTVASIAYLLKDFVVPVNKETNVPTGTQIAGVYSQTGLNLVQFNFTSTGLNTAEIGLNLNLTGGFLWAYDGYVPVEQGFHLWPDNVISTTATGAGSIAANTYYYAATYEWSDNQGNIFKSAPSIPISQVTTTASSTNTIKVPTLRLTAKTANPVIIVLYRWSLTQQVYYQVTSVTAPTTNDITADSVTIIDTFSDATILGNSPLYTTGGVVENIGPPACTALTLFKSRLVLIDAENEYLLWYSKQVIQNTPVEMNDLFTLFIAPTTGAQGSTGRNKCLFPMDDKCIIFKPSALYYFTGTGPDNTGANNDFSDPVFITSNVGSDNQNSIVFMPNGLMFESDKGIWLLGRDLSTTYIGKDVEDYTRVATVLSAISVPGTNQVRFTMSSGITLMYDYFFGQWGVFVGIPGLSSTLYQDQHTFINNLGQVFQESPGTYLDGSSPVLLSFTTGWLNVAGLQGFQRAYGYYLVGQYLTPHILTISTAYDYNSSPTQISMIHPDNFSAIWGGEQLWGSGETWGGSSNIEQWRVDLERQKCQAFQVTVEESYDGSFGVPAGAGLTLSGIDFVYGVKSTYPRLPASRQVG